MASFASLFQNRITIRGEITLSINQLRDASLAASNHQFSVNPTKVSTIFKSMKKDGQLWIMPIVAYVRPSEWDGLDEDARVLPALQLVSGRHRDAAILELLTGYGLNAAGKLTQRTETNATDLTDITDYVQCQLVECADSVALNSYLIAQNGSRTMTAPEKGAVMASCVKLTASQQYVLDFGKKIHNAIELPDGTHISLVTAGFIVGMLNRAIGKKASNMSAAVQDEFVNTLQSFIAENADSIPSNFSRNYKEVINPLFGMEAGTVIDEESGDEVEVTFIEYLASQIAEPVKATKAKASDAAATIAELQKQLAAVLAQNEALKANAA